MKKSFLLPLAAAALLALAGCGPTTSSSSSASGSSTNTSSSATAPSSSTSTATSSSPESSSSSSSSAAAVNTISEITKEGDYTVKGVVVGLNSKGYLIADETGVILVYMNATPTFAIGDYVRVSQTIATANLYNGLYQFTAEATITALDKSKAPVIDTTAVALTAAEYDGWAETITIAQVKKVKFTAQIYLSGTYQALKVEDASTHVIEFAYLNTANYTIVTGKSYDLEGYAVGWASKYSYTPFLLTAAVEHSYAATAVTVTAAGGVTSLAATSKVQLTAVVAPAKADQSVTWASSDADKATVSSTGLVTGVAVTDKVTITATSVATNTISGSIDLAITAAPSDPVTSIALDKTTASVVMNKTVALTATVLPATANTSVTYATGDATIATVDAAGLVTALKAGLVTITATTVGLSSANVALTATCDVTVTAYAAPVAATVAELITKNVSDTANVYSVSGILEGLSHTDTFGNGYLTDGTASIMIYGLTGTNGIATVADGSVAFTNPKDAVTSLAGVNNGDRITIEGVFKFYSPNPEIMGDLVARVADTTSYAITLPATVDNGTVVSDKTTAVYGETVTITVTPASTSFKVGSVLVKNAQGANIALTKTNTDATTGAITYTFVSGCVNTVTATFVANVVDTSFEMNITTLSTPTSYLDSTATISVNGTDVTIASKQVANYGDGLQMRIKSGVASQMYNTVAIPGYITSIVLTFNSAKPALSKNAFSVSAATTDAISTPIADDDVAFGSAVNSVYTISFAQSSLFSYFNIGHNAGGGAVYFTSIVVNFVPTV